MAAEPAKAVVEEEEEEEIEEDGGVLVADLFPESDVAYAAATARATMTLSLIHI